MLANPIDKFHSLPNIRGSTSSEIDVRRLYSLSMSQLRKHSEFTDYHHKPSPFNLRWIRGYNPKPGVINLNDLGSTTAFYAASYCGVLYNWTTNQMRILQGHRHMITCIAADARGRWLVTADSGPENIIIIWDSTDYFPQKTLYSPHGNIKLAKVAISSDAKYLLTLAYSDKTVLYWWIWSFGHDVPHAKIEVDLPKDSILDMGFNPGNTLQYLLLTKQDIWLGISAKVFVMERGIIKETDDYELRIRKVEKKIHPDNGSFTCYTFVEATAQVLVATSRGSVLIFGYTIEYQEHQVTADNYELLKFVKVLKMEKYKINVIKSVDKVIVTGNNKGEIHFYDEQMKLMYWVHGFQVDSVRGLSFNIAPRSFKIFDAKCKKLCPCWEKVVIEKDPMTGVLRQKLLKHKMPGDATVDGKPFIVRDFIVSGRSQPGPASSTVGRCPLLDADWVDTRTVPDILRQHKCVGEGYWSQGSMNNGVGYADFVTEKLHTILDCKVSPALSLTVHPEKPFVCIGYIDGLIEMFNFVQRQLFKRLDLRDYYKIVIAPKDDSIKCNYEITLPQLSATCLKYSPSGMHFACGLNTGQLLFLHPTTMDIITDPPFKDTKHAIQEINYSPDSSTLAFADAGRTVCVYKYNCVNFEWTFIGKHRGHYKDISTVFFLPTKNANGDYKLLSLGTDRIMVEYDIGSSSEEYLEVLSLDRVEQAAVPLAGIPWPSPKDLNPEEFRNDLPMILMANDEFKYKIVNYGTTMTLSTVLGPRYENPVCWMQLISRKEDNEESEYLVFGTRTIIGLQKLPLDGNPWKHVALVAHPVQIKEMAYREDLGILFVIGDKDSTVTQWAANYRSVDSTTKQGGGDLDPYYCIIENGRPGWLFQEIRDLFYYIQILCQGTFSPAMRRVKDFIPIDSLPDLVRALGFFPSEYEVENLIVEAKYKVYLRHPVTEIDFEEFVKLYLNHRPAFGDNYKRIKNAFKLFSDPEYETCTIDRDDFIEILGAHGECFSRELSSYLLSILSGQSFEDRAAMSEDDFSFLPQNLAFSEFVTNIIGIQEMDDVSEYSNMESTGSQLTGSTDS